jgi:hypothetical protein
MPRLLYPQRKSTWYPLDRRLGIVTKIMYAFFVSLVHSTSPVLPTLHDLIILILFPARSKYSPHYPLLGHPQVYITMEVFTAPKHAFPPCFSKIHSVIILPSTPRSYEVSLSLGFPIRILYTFLISSVRATYPVHLTLLDFIALIIFGPGPVQYFVTGWCFTMSY